MQPLEKILRNKLEKTVKEARDTAEAAAKASLEQLGVGEASPFTYLTDSQKELRRKLRAHGRQLGDERDPQAETQKIDRLVEEVAYEHWHRMLFSRFLAENNLLMYPDPDIPVAVTLEECEELAVTEGVKNGWELASRYAASMLPQIFRPNSPVFQLMLPPEHQQKLEKLLVDLPSEVFTASDSLGWVYQFWQAKKKDEVNDSEVKIGARELPAVTQLFTEPYMVSFLLDNSLGAWWAARRLGEEDFKTATSEEELRQKASLPGVSLEYLRFIKTGKGQWIPAAGTFDGWPEHLSELKTLDPCGGSGHFLVAAFLMLVPMRMEMEGLSSRDAVDAVLHDNLHGLEIDQRCLELAAFALALTAWRYPGAGGYRPLPDFNMACSGLSISTKQEDWLALAGDNNNLRMALGELYKQFKSAPVLGSLINPKAGLFRGTLIEMKWEDVAPLLNKVLSEEKDDEKTEMSVVVQGVAKAATLLAKKYNWVITNVPYKNTSEMVPEAKDFFETYHSESAAALETVFLDRCLEFCFNGGNISIVLPQNWLFLTTYRKFREKLLKHESWKLVARLGPGAFETISGEVVKAILFSINKGNWKTGSGRLSDTESVNQIFGLDVSESRQPSEKAYMLRVSDLKKVKQSSLLTQQSIFSFEDRTDLDFFGDYINTGKGICTGDSLRFVHKFWEQQNLGAEWAPFRTSVNRTLEFSGCENSLYWQGGDGQFVRFVEERLGGNTGAWIRGKDVWGHKGISVSRVSGLAATFYLGEFFDDNAAVLVPKEEEYLPAIWCYAESGEFEKDVRQLNQKLSVDNTYLKLIGFDIYKWSQVAAARFPNGLPKPYSEDPTQWIFHGHPVKSDEPLQVAVARLLGYRWPAELDTEIELSDEARTWVKKCGILTSYADEDGIVCIPPVRGEASAADQLLNLLAAAYGDSWSNDKLSELLKQADHAGKPLETWLREKFFTQHCKLFQHRPFIWHIWDGLRDGFAALVNYHKLDKKLLETLIYTYLGDWISRQKQDIANGVDGSQEKLDAAESLKKKLELILEGEAPYDIFVRWKPIEKQPIGWDPDLNDGVRLNIRPFMSVPDVSKKGAGVLRDKPNINWNKDRGTDVESAPWYNLGLEYGGKKGDRINDHHLSLKQKKEARVAAK
jgi:hypothetical protein